MRQRNPVLFSLTPGFNPVAGDVWMLAAVSTASPAMDKPLKRFCRRRFGVHPAETGC